MTGLSIQGVCVRYDGAPVLQDVTLEIAPGRIVGLVGESGCGKSTLLRACCGLLSGDAAATGRILLHGTDLLHASERTLQGVRGSQIGMVFQDPEATFCPVMRIETHALDALRAAGKCPKAAARRKIAALFTRLGLGDTERILKSYPHALSGGMKQRVSLALAMLPEPGILLADEPTAALDVVSGQRVLAMLRQVRAELGTGLLVATHQIASLYGFADEVAVMQAGKIVEFGKTESVFTAPQHPATRALLAASMRLAQGGAS